MKITVEMPLEDFAKFLKFREGKQEENKAFAEYRNRADKLVRMIYESVLLDEVYKKAQFRSYECAVRLLDLADEL